MSTDQIYFTILTDMKDQSGHTYQYGLNELDDVFNPYGSSVSGGLYCTDKDHVHEFYGSGTDLVLVKLPQAGMFDMALDQPDTYHRGPGGFYDQIRDTPNKYRVSAMILIQSYSLDKLSTYKKFGLDPFKALRFRANDFSLNDLKELLTSDEFTGRTTDDELCILSALSSFNVVQYLNRINYNHSIKSAAVLGLVHVLDSFKSKMKTVMELLDFVKPDIIKAVVQNEQMSVLDWFKETLDKLTNQLELGNITQFDYDCFKSRFAAVFEIASAMCKTHIMDWWINNSYDVKIRSEMFVFDPKSTVVERKKLFDWWELKGFEKATGHLPRIFDLCKHGGFFPWNECSDLKFHMLRCEQFDVIEFIQKHYDLNSPNSQENTQTEEPIKLYQAAFAVGLERNQIHNLEWAWEKSDKLKCTPSNIVYATADGNIEALEW